jgi:hypothetical protein
LITLDYYKCLWDNKTLNEKTIYLGEPDCSKYGTCTRNEELGVSRCICDPGYQSDDCSQFVCPGPQDNFCNGNGKFFVQ